MKPSYNKLLQEFTKQRVFTPKDVRFNFAVLGPDPDPEYRDILFIDQNKIFFSSYSKCLAQADIARLFEKLSLDVKSLESLSLKESETKCLLILSLLEKLIACVKDEKMWIYFTAQEKLVEILEISTNPKIIFLILKLLFSFLKTKLRVHELFLYNLSEESKSKLIFLVYVWALGINVGNRSDVINFNGKYNLKDPKKYTEITLNPSMTYNNETNFEQLANSIVKELKIYPGLTFSLHDLVGVTDLETLDELSNKLALPMSQKSINFLIFKIRRMIYDHVFPVAEDGTRTFDDEGHQRICLLSLISTNIIKSINKNSEMFDKIKNVANVFEEYTFEKNDEFAIDSLASTLPKTFVEADVFRNTMICIFNYYIYLHDVTTDLNDRLKEFFSQLLEQVSRATYLQTKLSSISDATTQQINFPTTNENVIEILRIVNLLYINESKIRNYHSSDYSNLFEIIIGLQNFYNMEIKKAFSNDVLQILLEINRLVMNELEKDKDMVLLDIFVENLKFYIEIYPLYRPTVNNNFGIYDNFLLLLFETLEAIDSYFIDPLKSQFIFHVPRVARNILEAEFWNSPILLEIMKSDDHFLFIFNELVVLFNDLLNEVAENSLGNFISKFVQNGLLKTIFDRFGSACISNEYDSLGFLVNLLSKVNLHAPNFFDDLQIGNIIKFFTDQLISKEALLNNLKRFNASDSHLALKNFSEELLEFCNVHPRLVDTLMRIITKKIKSIREINQIISEVCDHTTNANKLVASFMECNSSIKDYGWFKGNLTYQDIVEDLVLWQKAILNYIKFMIKFFDNHKTNVYQSFLKVYKEEFDPSQPFLDFIFQDCNLSYLFSEFGKQKKLGALLLKTSIITNNQTMITEFKEYLLLQIPQWQNSLLNVTSICSNDELAALSSVLHNKNRHQDENVSLNFDRLTKSSQSFLKSYTNISVALECIKFFVSSTRDTSNINDFFKNFMRLQQAILFADQKLVANGGYGFFHMLFEELETQSFEYYFPTNKNNAYQSLQAFYRTMKYLRENTNIETLYEITLKIVKSRIEQEDRNKIFPTFFITHFSEPIEEALTNPTNDAYSLVVVFFHINCLQEFLSLKKSFNDYNNFSNNVTIESIYYLSKVGFFSGSLISILKWIMAFIARNHKTIKYLYRKRQGENDLYSKDIICLFVIDDILGKLLKMICGLMDRLFDVKQVNFVITLNDGSTAMETVTYDTIELEKLALASEIISLLKSMTPENFYCFELEDKVDKEEENTPSKKVERTSSLKIDSMEVGLKGMSFGKMETEMIALQKWIPFKLEKSPALSTFLTEYENLFLYLFKNITELKIANRAVTSASPAYKKVNFSDLGNLSPEEFSKTVYDLELSLFKLDKTKLNENEIVKYSYPSKAEDPLPSNLKKPVFLQRSFYNEMTSKNLQEHLQTLHKNLEGLVLYFFNNFMKFKEGHKVLKHLWKLYDQTRKSSNSTSIIPMLFESTQQGLRALLSPNVKSRPKGDWKLLIKDKDPIHYLLSLQVDLLSLLPPKEAIEISKLYSLKNTDAKNDSSKNLNADHSNSKTITTPHNLPEQQSPGAPSKQLNEAIIYLTSLMDEQISVKQRRSHLQELIKSALDLLCVPEKTHDDKFVIMKSLSNLFKVHKAWLKSKERMVLMNTRVLKSLLSLMIQIFQEDEPFLEKLLSTSHFKIFKTLLRVKSDKVSPQYSDQIKYQFKALIETIILQPHVVHLLLEGELKNFLFSQPDKQFDFKRLIDIFSKITCGNEKLFIHVFNKVCEIANTSKSTQVARLNKTQDYTVRSSEIKPYIIEFISILMHDSVFKINKRIHKPEANFVFDHLVVSEALFFQVLPRYPLFYTLNLPKEKLLFIVHYFEKVLHIHPGYFMFLQPIFFDIPLLSKDASGALASVSKMIRGELIIFLMNYAKKLKDRLSQEQSSSSFLQMEIVEGDSKFSSMKLEDVVWALLNVTMFILQASKSEVFNLEISSSELPKILIDCYEDILSASVVSQTLNKNYLSSLFALPEVLRRRQVISQMNEEEMKALEKKAVDILYLNVPTTFRFSIDKWQTQRQKLSLKDFNITATNEVNYSFFNHEKKPDFGSIYRITETVGRSRGQRNVQNDMAIFRPVFEEDIADQNEDGEFWQDRGYDENDRESDEASWQSESNDNPVLVVNNNRGNDNFNPDQLFRYFAFRPGQNDQATVNLEGLPNNLGAIPNLARGAFVDGNRHDIINFSMNRINHAEVPVIENQPPLQVPPLPPFSDHNSRNSPRSHNRMDIEDSSNNNQPDNDVLNVEDNNHGEELENQDQLDEDEYSDIDDDNEDDDSSDHMEEDEESEDSESERLDIEDEERSSENENEMMIEIAHEMGPNEDEDDEDEDEDDSEESEIGFMEEHFDEEFNESYNENSDAENINLNYNRQINDLRAPEHTNAFNASSKIFESYPFIRPLNLTNAIYLYYNDAVIEEYKDKIGERILPFVGVKDLKLFESQQKEFKSFKSEFFVSSTKRIVRDPMYTSPFGHLVDSEARMFYQGAHGSRLTSALSDQNNPRVIIEAMQRLNREFRPIGTYTPLNVQLDGLFNDLNRFNSMRRGRIYRPNDENDNFSRNRTLLSSSMPAPESRINMIEEIMRNAIIVDERPPVALGSDNKNHSLKIQEEKPTTVQNDLAENNDQTVIPQSPFLKKQTSEIVNEPTLNQDLNQVDGGDNFNSTERGIDLRGVDVTNTLFANNDPSQAQNPPANILSTQNTSTDVTQPPKSNSQLNIVAHSTENKVENKLGEEKPNNLEMEKTPLVADEQMVEQLQNVNVIANEENRIAEVVEPRFDFTALGAPENFLEIANIDPTFFNALPVEIQTETVLMIGGELNLIQPNAPNRPANATNPNPPNNNNNQANPPNVANQNQGDSSVSRSVSSRSHQQMMDEQNNNLLFITSLSPELREEVLMTCPDEFLLSLPENIQNEARNLRDNAYLPNWAQNPVEDQQNPQNYAGNLATNRIKKALKKNKQKDVIKKLFTIEKETKLYQISSKLLDAIFSFISDPSFSFKNLPVGYLSSLLFDYSFQEKFNERLLSIIEEQSSWLQGRALSIIEVLSYSNFQFFHIKQNFDRFLAIMGKQKIPEKLINKFLKCINHILKTALTIEEKTERCDILITPDNLTHLTTALHSKQFDFSEPLSMILFLLSFSSNNLNLIVSNLQENIDRLALNLNIKFSEILEDQTKASDSEDSLVFIGKKIINTYDVQIRLLKIFKLLEQLFKRSFTQILKENEMEGGNVVEEKNDQFDKIKQQVLASFSNYFNQKNIRRVFMNLFKVLRFYELQIDKIVAKKQVSKPAFLKLQPLVESFFIIYKLLCDDDFLKSIKQNLRLTDNANNPSDIKAAEYTEQLSEASDIELLSQASNMSNSKTKTPLYPTGKHDVSDITIQSIFQSASKYNRNILNYFLGQISKVSQSPLSVLIRHASRIINFDIKRKYFSQSLQSTKSSFMLRLVVRRSSLFQDSYTQLVSKTGSQLRGKLHIRFQDEEGEDAGGVQREWYNSLSHEIFNPDYALFIPASHGYAYQPSAFSYINTDHLSYFKFIGKVVGKALFDGQLLDAHFTRSFYKHMTGTPLNYLDFEDYDPDYFRTLKWILENDVEDLEMDFSYQQDIFGKKEIKELKPNGKNIAVTNENKAEYVRLICEVKMTEEIRPQIQAYLEGLHSVIPHDLMKIFDPKELELMISGLPEIDLANLRENTDYVNYTKDSVIIRNFWDVLQSLDENLKAGFLQFVTGTSKVPFEGFQFLKGIGGAVQKFNIHKAYDTEKLPTSHTCMNQLDLPEYATKEELEEKLKKAILYGREGFGFI